MVNFIRTFHRFLVLNSVYALSLSMLLALGFYAWRATYTDRWWEYRLLVWNLFLAWIPYACAVGAAVIHRLWPRAWPVLLLPGALWLLFVPNAPYIVTDFYHLEWRPPMPLWYDIGLIAMFAFTGVFLGIASIRIMQRLVQAYLGRILGWLFAFVTIALCGLGIYLGRFGRYNSWDFFFHPLQIVRDLADKVVNPLDNLGFLGFTLMFTGILFVSYLMFVPAMPVGKEE
ncbi:MAG: DUF1361 domain-containing protein [Chloroflexota bacterium]